jgi:hypothetical protein
MLAIDEAGKINVKAMNIIFVLDSYNEDSISRMSYYQATLQTLSKFNPIYVTAFAMAKE